MLNVMFCPDGGGGRTDSLERFIVVTFPSLSQKSNINSNCRLLTLTKS